mmetsp:Transcript_9611/g.34133  ORF Transcript_9611/g.34133 Transcript_9611/m.34133 type:complete len:262 (-) Transcript_9611:1485-2270(-)
MATLAGPAVQTACSTYAARRLRRHAHLATALVLGSSRLLATLWSQPLWKVSSLATAEGRLRRRARPATPLALNFDSRESETAPNSLPPGQAGCHAMAARRLHRHARPATPLASGSCWLATRVLQPHGVASRRSAPVLCERACSQSSKPRPCHRPRRRARRRCALARNHRDWDFASLKYSWPLRPMLSSLGGGQGSASGPGTARPPARKASPARAPKCSSPPPPPALFSPFPLPRRPPLRFLILGSCSTLLPSEQERNRPRE